MFRVAVLQQNTPLPHNLMPLPYMPYGGVGANPYNPYLHYPNYFQQGAQYQQAAGPNAPPQGAYPYGAAGMHGGKSCPYNTQVELDLVATPRFSF